MKHVLAYIPMTCMKEVLVKVPNDATEADVKKKIDAGEYEGTGELEDIKYPVDEKNPIEIEMESAEIVLDEIPKPPPGYSLWVKRLGDCHLAGRNASETVCGMPMLGNNYAKHLEAGEMHKCDKCWENLS